MRYAHLFTFIRYGNMSAFVLCISGRPFAAFMAPLDGWNTGIRPSKPKRTDRDSDNG